jgi:hypothetical protein
MPPARCASDALRGPHRSAAEKRSRTDLKDLDFPHHEIPRAAEEMSVVPPLVWLLVFSFNIKSFRGRTI